MTDLTFTLISIFVDFFVEISVKWDQWCEYILKECKISPTTFWNFRFRCGILMKIRDIPPLHRKSVDTSCVFPPSRLYVNRSASWISGLYILFSAKTNKQTNTTFKPKWLYVNWSQVTRKANPNFSPKYLKNPYDISTTWRKAQVELVVFTCVVSSEQNPLKTTRRVPAGVRHNKVSRQWRRKLKRWGSDQICYFPNGKYFFVLVNY